MDQKQESRNFSAHQAHDSGAMQYLITQARFEGDNAIQPQWLYLIVQV